MNAKYKNLYQEIVSRDMTDLDEDLFYNEYSTNDEKFANLYSYALDNNLTSLDPKTFQSEYFGVNTVEKKNPDVTELPSEDGLSERFTDQTTKDPVRDSWNRPESDKWFGFNEELKQFTEGKNKGKDFAFRSPGDDWWGYSEKQHKTIATPIKDHTKKKTSEIYTNFPGKGNKEYEFKVSDGVAHWYEANPKKASALAELNAAKKATRPGPMGHGTMPVYSPEQIKKKEAEYKKIAEKIIIEDDARVRGLNNHFKKNASLDPIDQVYTNYDEEKKDNEYRINDGNWQRKVPGATSWTTVTDEGAISGLNRRYSKEVKYKPELKFVKQEPKLEFAGINTSLVSKTEEDAVGILSKKYGKYGFTFEQSGYGTDYIVAYNKDKTKEITVGFDEANPEEALKLKSFLEQNASKKNSYAYDKIQNKKEKKEAEGNYYKYISSDEYQNDFKSLSYADMEKELNARIAFINRTSDLEKSTERIQALYKTNVYQIFKEKKKEEFGARDERIDLLYTELQSAKLPADIKKIKSKITAYLTEDVIQDQVKNYSIQLNDLDKSAKILASDQKKYLQSVENFNKQSGQMTQEEFDLAKKNLEDQAEKLGTRADFLMSSGKSIQNDQKKLNVVAGKYFTKKEKAGSFGGGIVNSILTGISKSIIEVPSTFVISLTESSGSEYFKLSPEEKQYYKDKGYSKDQTINLLLNNKIKDFKAETRKNLIDVLGSDQTTQEYMKSGDRGVFAKAIFGVAESAPAMLMGFGGYGASFVALSTQAFSSIEDEMFSDPDFETSSAGERALVAVPYAIFMGVLENFGLKNIVKGSSFTGGIIKDILIDSIKQMPKDATKGVLQNIMTKEVKSALAKGTFKIVNGAIAEFETGATQSLVLDIGLKALYNEISQSGMTEEQVSNLSGGEMFATPDTLGELNSTVLEDGLAEAIGGATVSTFTTVASGLKNGNISLYNEDDLNYLKEISQDSEFKKLIVANLKTEMLKGNLTKSEAQERLDAMNELSSVIQSIPGGLSNKDQISAVNTLSEKNRLTKEIQGKDPALVTAQTDRINEINEELKNISKNATKEDNIVQQEGSISEYQGTNIVQENNPRKPGYKNTIVKKEESTTKSGVTEYKTYAVDENGNEKLMHSGGIRTTVGELAAASQNSSLFYAEDENGDLTILKLDPNTEVLIQRTSEGNDSRGNYEQRTSVRLIDGVFEHGANSSDFLTTKDIFSTPIYKTNTTTTNEKVPEVSSKTQTDSTVASKVQQEEQVATLRAEEQAELLKAIPKIESYKVNGEIDKTLMPKTVLAKYNKIYDKYDNLISPLLETTGEVAIDKPVITTNTTAEVQRVKSLTPESEDGATFNIDGTKYEGVGLVVPVDSMNTTTEELTPEMVADFVAERQEMIGDAGVVKAGIYKFPNSNQVSIDLSVVVPETSREQALEFARLAGQESLFDLETFENIKTGATGQNPMKFTSEQHREISKALKEGRIPNVFGATAETTNNLLTKENVKEFASKQKTTAHKLIVKAAKMVLNAIPGVKIYMHNNGQEMASAIEVSKKELTKEEKTGLKESSGLYVDGDIHINLESATIGTVYHEAFHALIEKNGMKSGSILLMAKGLKNIISDKGIKQRLDDFVSQYNEDEKAGEYISELGGILSEAEQELTTTKLQQFKTLINNIAKKLGLPVIFSASATAQDAADFINTMSKKLRTGENILADGFQTNIISDKIKSQIPVKVNKNQKLTSVKQSDIIDIKSLVDDIVSKNETVWFWVADQLGRGVYFDSVINGNHYLDAGPSYALDPENRSKNIIWASGANPKTLNNNIDRSDYIFIISGSPQSSKLFNKKVSGIVRSRIEDKVDFNEFKKSILNSKPTKQILNIIKKHNSYDELFNGSDRKAVLISINEQKSKNTKLNKVLESYDAFIDLNELRDGFYKENDFKLGDVMLVLKPEKIGDKSNHSTYETDIIGSVIGVPDLVINSFDLMTDEVKNKYKNNLERVQQQQIVAPYGMGVKNISKIKFQKNKTDKLTAPVAGNKLFNEPLKQALDIAKSYMKSIGKEYSPVEKITKLDEGLSKRISDAYDKMKDDPTNPEVKAAYEVMAKETLDQYDAITAKGYKLEINNNEPYSSSEDMINDLRDNNRMKIFSTESGFGEEPITDKQREENILLKDSGRKDANGETLLVNDVFRFVHDFFGHAKLGNSFGPIGEENAWRVHSEMYSPEAKKAMTSETRGQNSWVNFSGVNDAAFKKREKARQLRKEGKIDQANQMVGEVYDEMKFADQKIGLLPSFAVEEGATSKIKFQKSSGVGYRSGDLTNKAETKGKFEGGDRSTGHFGTGFYFFGTKKKADEYSNRETNSIDLNGYNLANGTIKLHNLLKDVNKYAIGTQKENDSLKYSIENIIRYFNKNISINNIKDLNDQNNKIKSIIDKINNNNIDSPSTVVMKALGFDGVDSRGTDLDNAQYGSVLYSLKKSEEGATSKIKFQKTRQETRMDNEAEDIFKKSLDRGVAWNTAIQNVIGYIQKSKWYEEASDIDREQKIRDFRQSKKQKLKKAPSVDKILGTPKPSTVTVKEKTALKDQIKLEARAAREAKVDLNEKRKLLSTAIKGLVKLGKLTTRQAATIINRVSVVNLDNQVMVNRLADYAARVFEKADYQERLSRAFSFRKGIRKLLKGDIQAEVVGMAKKFSKIDPSMVDDIEKYLEMAEIVKNAIKPSRVNRKDLDVNMRESMNIDSVSEFTNDAIENQEAILKEELLAVHSELVDAGVIDDKMSLSDIESIINSLKEKEDGADYEGDILTFLSRRIDTMSAIIKDILTYKINPMTGEDVALTEKNIDLISRMLNIDINNVSIKEAIFIAEAMDNFINNNITSSVEAVIEKHEGATELENLIADKVVASPLRKYFSNKIGQYMSEQIASMPILFEKLFVGAKNALMVAKKMGWTALINGVNKAEKMFNTTVDVYFKQYSKTKPNGKSFNDAENVYERGMLAFLSRNVSGTVTQQAEELKRRVEVLKESVKNLLEGSTKEQKMGEIYQKIYDKLNVESGDIDIISANVDKINKSAVNWWINQWGTTYNDLSDISLSVYNTMLSSDTSYSTDRYKLLDKANLEEIIEPKNIGAFGRDIEFLDKNKTGVLMESNRPSASKVSKANRYISLDFDVNNSSAYKAALIDVNTAAAIRRIDGFINSKNFNKLIPTKEDRDIFRRRISEYIQAAKNKRVGPSDTMHYLDQLTNFLGGIGVGKALGGIDQIVKQTLPIALSTFTNSGRLDILTPASNAWIDSLGMAISNRGQESQSTIESIDRRLDKANSGAKVVSNFIVDAQQIWLKWCLSKPDVFIAKSSFISYYKQYLSKNNQSTDIDWATHNVNQDAADYAMLMVDRQQNVSDAKMAGKVFNSQNSTTKIMRKLFLPFASFSLNQKSRMVSDIKVLGINSGASKQDKIIAARSLLSLPLEMVLYQSIGLAIRLGYLAIAKGIIGAVLDDDDEEKEKLLGMEISKEMKNATKYSLRSMVTDFLSPIPIADNIVVEGANYLLSQLSVDQDMIDEAVSKKNLMLEVSGKEKMNDKEKQNFIEKYKQDREYQLFNDEKKSYGTIGIGYDTYKELMGNINTAYTGKYTQDYMGNKSERFLLPKDQDNIKNAVIFEALFALGIVPRDVNTVTNNIIKLSKKNSLTETQYEKYKAVGKETGGKVTGWKMDLVKSKSKTESTLEELEWIKGYGGLTEKQGQEYIKLSKLVDEVSYMQLMDLQSGMTADKIIKSY
jgi:hypothetical protein